MRPMGRGSEADARRCFCHLQGVRPWPQSIYGDTEKSNKDIGTYASLGSGPTSEMGGRQRACLIRSCLAAGLCILVRIWAEASYTASVASGLHSCQPLIRPTSGQISAFTSSLHMRRLVRRRKAREESFDMGDGFRMQVLSEDGKKLDLHSPQPPPLVFIHGSFHSAWCWAEKWMGYLAEKGYPSYAISLRGTAWSPDPLAKDVRAPSVEQHVVDLLRFLRLKNLTDPQRLPIIIAHSFGGIVAMKALEGSGREGASRRAQGVALLCSVPPYGNGPMTKRFMESRGWRTVWDITRGFVLKDGSKDAALCKKFFFSEEMSEDEVEKHRTRIQQDANPFFDLNSVSRRLPSLHSRESVVSDWVVGNPSLERLVVGASDDFLVDHKGIQDTAQFLGVPPLFVKGAHDVMLDVGWKENANVIADWLEGFLSTKSSNQTN
ncbi:hypothetical protein AAMO2058_001658900 [Amorphochlora amoebiformis]